jgi:hypothetical protein
VTAVSIPLIRCNECGEREVGTPFPARNHREVRKHNRPCGWRFTRDGRDLCPDCSGATPTR